MKGVFRIFLMLILACFFTLPTVFSAVEVFTHYDTEIVINEDYTLDVHKVIMLRNVHNVGIVPGEVVFQIVSAFDNNGGKIIDFEVIDRYGKPITSSIQNVGGRNIIVLKIFTPVLPGFEYKIDLKYTIEYEPSGIFFKNLQFPLKEVTQIPIQEGTVKVILPESYHVTYLDYSDELTVIEENVITWEIMKDTPKLVNLEYSYIPIGFSSIKGSLLFWITINILLIIVLFVQILKEVRKLKKQVK